MQTERSEIFSAHCVSVIVGLARVHVLVVVYESRRNACAKQSRAIRKVSSCGKVVYVSSSVLFHRCSVVSGVYQRGYFVDGICYGIVRFI